VDEGDGDGVAVAVGPVVCGGSLVAGALVVSVPLGVPPGDEPPQPAASPTAMITAAVTINQWTRFIVDLQSAR
jgi:hypothetical protein